jgi:DNA-binding CsgD family transcriptional regulator
MNLTVKEKEKYVLKIREEGKTYRDIAHELRMSPREISKILKKVNGELEEKERKKIVLSNTAKALQLFKKGKSPTEVAIKLDLSPEEARSLYFKYLSLNNLNHFVETFKQFDNDSIQDFIDYYDLMKENGIRKEEIVEAVKMINDLPNIREEYQEISDQLPDLQKEREFYISDNKLLINKNYELNNEYNSLLSKIESSNRMLELTDDEINKKNEYLENIKNSKDYTILKNEIEKQINDFLNQKKELLKLAVMTILKIMKDDPDKETLINNILNPNENPDSGFYLISYEERLADIAVDTLSDIALEINTNNILHS